MKKIDEKDSVDESEPDDFDNVNKDAHIIDETNPDSNGKVRRRIKVRKRIRVRKKPSIKKKLVKFGEMLFWVVIVVGFISALIIMVVELDIQDEKVKNKKKSNPTKFVVELNTKLERSGKYKVLFDDEYISKFARPSLLNFESIDNSETNRA